MNIMSYVSKAKFANLVNRFGCLLCSVRVENFSSLFLSIQSNQSLLISHWMTAESSTTILMYYEHKLNFSCLISNPPAF